MKKIFITLSIITLIFTLYIVSINIVSVNKVIYELSSDYRQLSIDSMGEDILTEDVIVQVKLDVEDFNNFANIDINENINEIINANKVIFIIHFELFDFFFAIVPP